jgi:hypothetical protein
MVRRVRDRRLDFWRGLCLADMVLVHLVYEGLDVGPLLARLIGDYVRFAAGGFVFVAGASVGAVFLPRARDGGTRRATYRALRQRAAYVLGVHYAAAASFAALDVLAGRRAPIAGAGTFLLDLLTFRDAPPYGDILPLYVVLLVLSPALLALLRRGYWPVVAGLSTAAFALGQWYPWVTSPRVPELFPVILWQAVFVSGLLFGAALPRLDRAPPATRVALTAVAAGAFAGVLTAGHGGAFGLPAVTFQKVPLNAAELARYVTLTLVIVLGTGLLWGRLEGRAPTRFVEGLGRRSLFGYVAHVWVQTGVMAVAVHYAWLGRAQVLLAPAAIAALGALAAAVDAARPSGPLHVRLAAALRRGAALPAGVLTAALLVGIVPQTTPPASREAPPLVVAEEDVSPALEASISDTAGPAADADEPREDERVDEDV